MCLPIAGNMGYNARSEPLIFVIEGLQVYIHAYREGKGGGGRHVQRLSRVRGEGGGMSSVSVG